MNSQIQDKRLRTPLYDLKKKPTPELLKLIAKQSSSEITAHPFSKVKEPMKEKIENIFIKSQGDRTKIVKGGGDKKNVSNKKLKKKSK